MARCNRKTVAEIGRWAALGAGLSYGFVHARTLRNEASEKRIEADYAHKVALIEEAKKKYAEKNAPKGGDVQFNFEDPNFDADKWFKHIESKF
ncbi:hypothetical protein GQ54DRAFT_6175 [Martensiomyces pterosporus]|nr:hypothetical protein GQ54DRAFT_6175 [Martensiomyces pterosporus]